MGRQLPNVENHYVREREKAKKRGLWSISPTFYAQLFRKKVFCAAFLYLHFRFVSFWHMKIGAKAACKMLVKLTPGERKKGTYNRIIVFESWCFSGRIATLKLPQSLFLLFRFLKSTENLFQCLTCIAGHFIDGENILENLICIIEQIDGGSSSMMSAASVDLL